MLDGQARLHRIGGIEATILLFDDHFRAGCGLETDRQVVAQVVADSSPIAPHAPSAKTPTLQNKIFPVIDRHGPSVGMPQMGDTGLELSPFSAGSRSICLERDAESDAYLHEKASSIYRLTGTLR